MKNLLFENIHEENKVEAIKDLIEDSTPRPSFFFLVIMSVSMATCGLLINNTAVLIASMLIAPLLSPVLSLALGIIMNDGKLISRSFYVILKSIIFSIGISFSLTWFLWTSGRKEYFIDSQIDFLTKSSIVYLLITVRSYHRFCQSEARLERNITWNCHRYNFSTTH